MTTSLRPGLLVSLLLLSGSAGAQTPLPTDGSFAARGHIQYLADTSRQLTLADVQRDSARFRPVPTAIPQFKLFQPPYWLRFSVQNPSPQAATYVVDVENPLLTSVQFFVTSSAGSLLGQSSVLGWPTPRQNRWLEHRYPLVQVRVPARGLVRVYLRAYCRTWKLTVPVRLYTEADFAVADRVDRAWWYWLGGVLCCILFLSGVLFVAFRQWVYGHYFLYVLFSLLYLLAESGLHQEWVDTLPFGWSPPGLSLQSVSAQLFVGLLFTGSYVLAGTDNRRARWFHRLAVRWYGLNIGLGILKYMYAGYRHDPASTRLLDPVIALGFVGPFLILYGLLFAVSFGRPFRGSDTRLAGRNYLLALTPLLLQAVLTTAQNYGFFSGYSLIGIKGVSLSYLFELVVLSIGLGYRYKRIVDERRTLAIETANQRQQLLETQLHAQRNELRMAQAQLRLQEEKERIARDLHDHVGAQLSVIAANAASPGSTKNGTGPDLMGDYAREAIQSLRDTVWAIDQSALTLADFGVKLRQYLNRQQQQHPVCTYSFELDAVVNPELTSAQALNLFRQVQEAVHNAFKHAQASRIIVRCQVVGYQLTVSVTDNGLGFDTVPPLEGVVVGGPDYRGPVMAPAAQYGLRNLQRRAAEMQGECCIDSKPGQGTRVTVTIPLAG